MPIVMQLAKIAHNCIYLQNNRFGVIKASINFAQISFDVIIIVKQLLLYPFFQSFFLLTSSSCSSYFSFPLRVEVCYASSHYSLQTKIFLDRFLFTPSNESLVMFSCRLSKIRRRKKFILMREKSI